MSNGEEFKATQEGVEVFNREIGRQILEETLKILVLRQEDPKLKGKADTFATEANIPRLLSAAVFRLRLKEENINDALQLIVEANFILKPNEAKSRREFYQELKDPQKRHPIGAMADEILSVLELQVPDRTTDTKGEE